MPTSTSPQVSAVFRLNGPAERGSLAWPTLSAVAAVGAVAGGGDLAMAATLGGVMPGGGEVTSSTCKARSPGDIPGGGECDSTTLVFARFACSGVV